MINDMKTIYEIKSAVEQRLHLTFADELHLIISFLMALAIRGDVLESTWAILPLVAIFAAKEVYDCLKDNATGFSFSDLRYDFIGGIVGYIIALIV